MSHEIEYPNLDEDASDLACSMSDPSSNPEAVTDALIALLNQSEPFLDTYDYSYCRISVNRNASRATYSLRDNRIVAYLCYQCFTHFGLRPRRSQVRDAIDLVEGRLLSENSSRSFSHECPVLGCLARVFLEDEDGVGSANEILAMLRRAAKNHLQLRTHRHFPSSPTAMGKYLARNQLQLRVFGIILTRPSRVASKRLWHWSVIVPNQANDTLHSEVSLSGGTNSSEYLPDPRPNDTMTDDELTSLLGASLDDQRT